MRNAIDLAQQTERFGYRRYWFAEHHLNPGVLGVSPAVSIALIAGRDPVPNPRGGRPARVDPAGQRVSTDRATPICTP